jgi:hypothetical protein
MIHVNLLEFFPAIPEAAHGPDVRAWPQGDEWSFVVCECWPDFGQLHAGGRCRANHNQSADGPLAAGVKVTEIPALSDTS